MSARSKDNDEVRRFLHAHVPEIASGAVQIKGVEREAGQRAIVAVHASNDGICAVGACAGLRGEHIKALVRALSGDTVEIMRWSESVSDYIRNLLAPARVEQIDFDTEAHRATVTVSGDTTRLTQDGGVRLRLASRLAGWDLHFC
jgi:N utilization substance protein A